MLPRYLRRYGCISKKCWHSALSGERGMTENASESLSFEPPEQENIRLREENARLRRLLAVHSIAIPQLAPENPPPAKAVEIAQPIDREERARRRIALFRSLFRGREDVYARRWPARIYARGLEGLEGYQRKPSRPPIKINEIRAANLTSYQLRPAEFGFSTPEHPSHGFEVAVPVDRVRK